MPNKDIYKKWSAIIGISSRLCREKIATRWSKLFVAIFRTLEMHTSGLTLFDMGTPFRISPE
jgi:hypothetical protein